MFGGYLNHLRMSPGSVMPNSPNRLTADTDLSSHRSHRQFWMVPNEENVVASQDTVAVRLTKRRSGYSQAGLICVQNVACASNPFEIAQRIIEAVTVLVIDLQTTLSWLSKKRASHQTMNIMKFNAIVSRKNNLPVFASLNALTDSTNLRTSSPQNTTNVPSIGYLIDAFISWYCPPKLCLHAFYYKAEVT